MADVAARASGAGFDEFISYANPDDEPATRLATSLGTARFRAFLCHGCSGVSSSIAQEEALRTATHGILIFCRTTMQTPAIRDEYATLLRLASAEAGLRSIPVCWWAMPKSTTFRRSWRSTNRWTYAVHGPRLRRTCRPLVSALTRIGPGPFVAGGTWRSTDPPVVPTL